MKKLMPVVLAVLMALSVYMLVSERMATAKEYNAYIEEARELGDTGVVIRSAQAYDNALALNDNFELELEKIEMYYNNEYFSAALNLAEDFVEKYPKEVKAYEFLCKLYIEENEHSDFFKLVDEVQKRKLKSAVIDEMLAGIKYVYDLGYSSYEEVRGASGGFWAVRKGELWGYLDATGSLSIDYKFKSVSPFVLSKAAVEEPDGSRYYVDTEGNKTNVPAIEGNITDLGVFTDVMTVAVDGKYGYYTNEYEYKFGAYDYAGTFSEGVAAVKTGEKWQIVKNTGELLTTSEFSDIVVDEKGVAFRNNRLFVATDEKYYLIDELGNKVSDATFDGAKAFLCESPAAVKVGDKWGFVDTSGNMVIEAQYDDALSFVNGFAAVCKDGKWGYINTANEVCIEFQFDDALNFNENDVSFVKENDDWMSLTLLNTVK